MDSLLSFPVGLFHPLQHAGLARRTRDTDYLSKWMECPIGQNGRFGTWGLTFLVAFSFSDRHPVPVGASINSAVLTRMRGTTSKRAGICPRCPPHQRAAFVN